MIADRTAAAAVCVGESMAVLLPDRPGDLSAVGSFQVAVGGAESNVACGLARLGVASAWISRVGDDGFGRRIVGELAAQGVDVSAVSTDPGRPTGLYVKETGERTRMHYYRTGSAASALGPASLTEPAVARVLDGARLVHLSGITPALSASCLDLVRLLLGNRRHGQVVSFDLNWRPVLWQRSDPAVLAELLNAADLVLLGRDGAEAAFGTGEPQELRAMFPGPDTLVLKDSEREVVALDRDGSRAVERGLAVEVVEPTGAGDAFAAGYLAGLLRKLDQRSRLRLGHLAAATALTAPGDYAPMPADAVVNALLGASPDDWAATRVTPDGIQSPVLPVAF